MDISVGLIVGGIVLAGVLALGWWVSREGKDDGDKDIEEIESPYSVKGHDSIKCKENLDCGCNCNWCRWCREYNGEVLDKPEVI